MNKPIASIETSDRVIKVIAEQLGTSFEALSLKSDLASEFHMDSLDRVELAMTLEDEFGVEIPDDVLTLAESVEDFVSIVVDPSGAQLRNSRF